MYKLVLLGTEMCVKFIDFPLSASELVLLKFDYTEGGARGAALGFRTNVDPSN